MNNKIWVLVALITTCLPFNLLFSQDEPGVVTKTYALTNVHITTSPGNMIKNGTVIIRDGLIQSVGQTVSIPADAEMVPCDTMHVYAGFIDGLSHIGAKKPKEEDRPKDKDPGNPTNERAGITPEKSLKEMLNASEKSIKDYRAVGYTASHSVPHGRMMPGMGSIILLDGKDASELLYKSDISSFGQLKGAQGVFPNTIIAVLTKWRELYKQSQQASTHISKYNMNSSGMSRPKYDDATHALIPVTKRSMPMFISTPNHLDIYRVMSLQKDLGFKMVLSNVKNAYRLTEKIKSSNTPILLSLDLFKADEDKEKEEDEKEMDVWEKEKAGLEKRKKEEQKNIIEQASQLSAKGVRFGFSTDGVGAKKALENVRRMIKAGLSEKDALAALTTNTAQIIGVSNSMGTIQNGKIANIIVANGPIFDEKTKIRYVFVDGNMHEYEIKEKSKKESTGEVSEENKAFVGTWEFTMTIQGQSLKGELDINQSSEGTLEGSMSVTGLDDTVEIEEIEVDGNNITYTTETQGIEISWKGKVEGETMTGQLSAGPIGVMDIEATRTSGPDQL